MSRSTHALRRTLSRAGSSGANDHPPAPHPQAGGRLHQAPPLRRGLGTPYGNDRGAWTRGGGSAYTPPGLVVSCGVGISVVWVREVVLIPHQAPGSLPHSVGVDSRSLVSVLSLVSEVSFIFGMIVIFDSIDGHEGLFRLVDGHEGLVSNFR